MSINGMQGARLLGPQNVQVDSIEIVPVIGIDIEPQSEFAGGKGTMVRVALPTQRKLVMASASPQFLANLAKQCADAIQVMNHQGNSSEVKK